jgi:hypothetical protein
VWTVFTVAPIAVGAVFGFATLNDMVDMVKMVADLTKAGSFTQVIENIGKKFGLNSPVRNSSHPEKPVKLLKKDTEKITVANDAGWDRKALALWQDGKYADAEKAVK